MLLRRIAMEHSNFFLKWRYGMGSIFQGIAQFFQTLFHNGLFKLFNSLFKK